MHRAAAAEPRAGAGRRGVLCVLARRLLSPTTLIPFQAQHLGRFVLQAFAVKAAGAALAQDAVSSVAPLELRLLTPCFPPPGTLQRPPGPRLFGAGAFGVRRGAGRCPAPRGKCRLCLNAAPGTYGHLRHGDCHPAFQRGMCMSIRDSMRCAKAGAQAANGFCVMAPWAADDRLVRGTGVYLQASRFNHGATAHTPHSA